MRSKILWFHIWTFSYNQWFTPKRYDVKERAVHVFWVNQKFKDCNSIDASPYTYPCIKTCIMIYISWWVYFVTGLNLVLLQPSTAALAKTKADIMKNSSYSYLPRWFTLDLNISTTPLRQWGFPQCIPFSWTTLRGEHCWHPIAVMGVVYTFGLGLLNQLL